VTEYLADKFGGNSTIVGNGERTFFREGGDGAVKILESHLRVGKIQERHFVYSHYCVPYEGDNEQACFLKTGKKS
jgi:hypothetical protein